MFVENLENIDSVEMNIEGALNVMKQAAVGKKEGWGDHVMRVFTITDKGHTPKHSHEWPHINYIIEGEGVLHMDGVDHPVRKGSVAYVPAGTEHQFKSASSEVFRFVCIVPEEGEG
ncbi:cupin domain-containing protein [Limisalsivibrio acetivorans]|uniref:cupin domain-containing protein n=1 Tax=Limisalsivibrio acetivorans TaxID=1304888 RepID=UPI0003B36B47|nr:cupin domain-containing protein [Limisalsivibrio acetivorans]